MTSPSLWSRIKNADLFRVLVIYGAASWVLLQIVGLFIETMDLPRWTMPWTLVILLAGLIVVLVTAWVQSHPSMPGRETADEVPGDWEVDVREIKESISKGRLPHLNWMRVILGGVVAFSLLFGLAGLYVVIQDRGRSFSPPEALAEAAPGIAVLPFTVQGAELDVWREGMVDLLSTNLDGAAGLRSIDSRTVLARWGEQVPAGQTADLASALEVGRRAGARYVLLGNAVSLGSSVRLSAEVYAVDGAKKLGQAQVLGAPDSVFALVDELSIEVLRAILQGHEGDLPNVNLARTTTTSLPALKAYLEGEVLFRRGEFDAAVPVYERAVEADSTFALALYRLGITYGWAESVVSDLAANATERAAHYADRLPEREAVLVRAELALTDGTLDGIEPLERAVRRYPDDSEAWYLLGETYFHLGDEALVPRKEAEAAFARATQLDPRFLPAYIHRLDYAFTNADSAQALALIDSVAPLAAESDVDVEANRAAYALAFGDAAARERAWAIFDTLSGNLVALGLQAFSHPRFREIQARLYQTAIRNRDPDIRGPTFVLAGNQWQRGRMSEALATMDGPGFAQSTPSSLLYTAWLAGLPVPGERLDRELALENVFGEDGVVRALDLFFAGAYAADREREPDRAAARGQLRDLGARLRVNGDSVSARFADGAGLALDGMLAWRRGDLELAAQFLEEGRGLATGHLGKRLVNRAIRWKLGELMAETGRLHDAERYFASISYWHDPLAYRRLGDLYVEMEEFDKARASYEMFLAAWSDPDPALASIAAEARQKLAGISPLRRE